MKRLIILVIALSLTFVVSCGSSGDIDIVKKTEVQPNMTMEQMLQRVSKPGGTVKWSVADSADATQKEKLVQADIYKKTTAGTEYKIKVQFTIDKNSKKVKASYFEVNGQSYPSAGYISILEEISGEM
jgi:hypothetical protein